MREKKEERVRDESDIAGERGTGELRFIACRARSERETESEREWWKAASVVYNSAGQRWCHHTEAPLIFIPISWWCMKERDRRLTNASIQSNAVLSILKASFILSWAAGENPQAESELEAQEEQVAGWQAKSSLNSCRFLVETNI